MASEAKASGTTDPTRPGTTVDDGEQISHSMGQEELRHRAYDLYLERGAQPGYELDDWLQAERELSQIHPS